MLFLGSIVCSLQPHILLKKPKGTTFDEYSIDDLRKFFGKYFLKQNNLSQELTFEIMKLKALLGGSDRSITKNELRKFVGLIECLRQN